MAAVLHGASSAQTAVLTVTNLADHGPGTLSDVLEGIETGTTNIITFDTALSGGTIQLSNTLIVSKSTTVWIDASDLPGGLTISGEDTVQIFTLISGSTSLTGITLRNGGRALKGGGIWNFGDCSLHRCTLLNNSAATGGGIYNVGVLTLEQCMLSNNSATNDGGGVYNFGTGTLTLERCTLLNNSASNDGGGAYNFSGGALVLRQCTLLNNSATNSGGGIYNQGRLTNVQCTLSGNAASRGGGIYNRGDSATLALESSVIAGNTSETGPDIMKDSGTLIRIGQNLIGNNDTVNGEFPAGNPNSNHDPVGSPDAPLDACLAPLDDYGGFTKTRPPLRGSPAIDAGGSGFGNTILIDQRGFPRVVGAAQDLGAVEAQGVIVVSTNTDRFSPPVTIETGISLREALSIAVPKDTLKFDNALSGQTIRLTNSAGALEVAKDVTVDASGLAGGLTLSGDSNDDGIGDVRILCVNSGIKVALRCLTIYAGHTDGGGGGIHNQGDLRLERCTLIHNTAAFFGGAIFNDQGALALHQCTLAGNSADKGGGVSCRSGNVALTECTIAANFATNAGGGIYLDGDSLALTNSIIANNAIAVTTLDAGPDIHKSFGGIMPSASNLIGNNTTVTTNFPPSSLVGSAERPIDALLTPLGSYGGPTRTMPPLIGSPALDAGTLPEALTNRDQRGFARVIGSGLDIGAVEAYLVLADSAWDVREIKIIPGRGYLNSLSDAENLVFQPATALVFHYQSQVISRQDPEAPGGGGFFEGPEPFASDLISQNDDDFLLLARCVIVVPEADNYTFGFSTEDGAQLKLYGTNFTSFTSLNPNSPATLSEDKNTLRVDGPTANSDALGVCFLQRGTYGLEFLYYAGGGEAYCEVFAARGIKTNIDTSFRLVGHAPSTVANNRSGLDSNGWEVTVLKTGATSVSSAAAQLTEYWSTDHQHSVTSYVVRCPALNFVEPGCGSGGRGFDPKPFPGLARTNEDRNFFALGGRAVLNIEPAGEYTFWLSSDNGARFRIKGSRGWIVGSSDAALMKPDALLDGMQATGCCADVFGTVHLAARPYEVEVIYSHAGGPAYLGLWIARGRYDTFSPAFFSLLQSSGGFVESTPVALSGPADSAPPMNDNFARAIGVSEAAAGAAGSNIGASMEELEPSPLGLLRSVWWKWEASASGLTQADTIGSNFDTILAVYKGSGLADLTQVANNDNSGPNGTSRLTFEAEVGVEYCFQVGGASNHMGQVRLNLGPAPTPPANRDREHAQSLSSDLPVSIWGITTMQAPAAWFKWVAPAPGTLGNNAEVIADNAGSSFSTKLTVYTNDVPLVIDERLLGYYVPFQATPGTTYWIAVEGATGSDWGSYVLNISTATKEAFSPRLVVPTVRPSANEGGTVFTLNWDPEPFATEPFAKYAVEQTFALAPPITWTPVAAWTNLPEKLLLPERVSVLITNDSSASSVFFRLRAEPE
jgi:hypothetical protein